MKLNIENKICQPDPFVIFEDGTYFMYSSNSQGVSLHTSKDMLNWDFYGFVYQEKGMWEYWAPCIIKIENKFYIYVSFRPFGEEDPHQEHLIVASSSSPFGPFKFEANLVEPFSIDPHVVRSGNSYYIFYSVNDYEASKAGTYIVVDKLISPTQVDGHPVAVLKPSLEEEIFAKNRFKEGQDWYTLEGAFYFRRGDYHYVMYSGNCYQNVNYFVGYAVCHSSLDDLRELKFEKMPDENSYSPIIRKDQFEEGTGHNSVLIKDDKLFMFYHARDNGILTPGKEQRTARIALLEANGKELKIVERTNIKL